MHELLSILIGIGVVYFGFLATGEGMILHELKNLTTRLSCWVWENEAAKAIEKGYDLDDIGWFRKIVWACPYCMCNPFTWGGLAYFACVYKGFLQLDVLTWFVYCVVLSGLLKFIDLTAEKMGANIDFGG